MKKILLLTATILFAFNIFAEEIKKESTELKEASDFQKVIDQYKEYVSTISPEIREEIIAYRKAIAQLNKKKVLLYRKLSQSSQDYLKKEKQYKKKLPMDKKKMISKETLEVKKSPVNKEKNN